LSATRSALAIAAPATFIAPLAAGRCVAKGRPDDADNLDCRCDPREIAVGLNCYPRHYERHVRTVPASTSASIAPSSSPTWSTSASSP
jgi:hypothetical protein